MQPARTQSGPAQASSQTHHDDDETRTVRITTSSEITWVTPDADVRSRRGGLVGATNRGRLSLL